MGASIAAVGAQLMVPALTLIRTRGEVMMRVTTADAEGSGFHGAFGIAIANANAFTVGGIASLLTPLADDDWDGWFFHRYFALFSGGPLAGAASQDVDEVNPVAAALRFEVDSKAMRKMTDEEVIYAAIDVVEVGTTVAMGWAFNSRGLFKLP